ncbi:hypothetical protein B0T14DRAFT_586410 [Immersiella caudata]|uniref:CCHC-type domain-containing protein n=1 Tax=Immersiella caudata TaxID=314043 RepID=A0AA40C082_9PEZI|nr:hypothetical protein B0T14DRAFT_586410 [Immersiella caudata]
MANTAPGQSSAQSEPVCYNCGASGHWMVACPEPTRDKPAGLERWQSQHQDHSASSDRSSPSHEKKGPIVTRYPLPPGQAPPVQRYGPPHPFPSAGGPPLAYPQPGYPPPPPPPYAGSYAPPPPQYGQYPPPPPIAPPHQYGQQPPVYGQPQYPQAYPPAPPPPPPTSTGYYSGGPPPPPAAYPPSVYPSQPYGAPPPPPGPYPQYAAGAPPPPPDYQYPPAPAPGPYPPPPPNAGSYPPQPPPPPPPGVSFDRPPGLPPRPPPPLNQNPPEQHNRHRGRHQRHQGKRGKDRSRPGNDGSAKNGHNRNEHNRNDHNRNDHNRNDHNRNDHNRNEKQRERRHGTPPPADQPPKEKAKQAPVVEVNSVEETGEWDPESEQDLKHVFVEKKMKPADPVGIPLPAEYSDVPTIPPAYNAKCVKSEFFKESNLKEYALPVRATALWSEARWDPVFKPYPGMVMRRFSGSNLDYPSYDPPSPLSPSAEIKMPPRYQVQHTTRRVTPEALHGEEAAGGVRSGHDRYRSPDASEYRESPPTRNDRDIREDRRHAKRSRDHSLDDFERGSKGPGHKRSRKSESRRETPRDGRSRHLSPARRTTPSPVLDMDKDPWSPQAGESSVIASSDQRYLDVVNDGKSSSSREERAPYNTNTRHDSGYHSGQSLDKARTSRRNDDRDWSAHQSAQKRKTPSRSRSRASSPDEQINRSRSESPLTALEAELLGLTDEPSEKKVAPRMKPKKPMKRVKVAAAFR